VGGEQRSRAVQDGDAAGREDAEGPEPVFDAVERRQDVEPSERGVARPELTERLERRHRHELGTARARGRKAKRGRRGLLRDEGDEHCRSMNMLDLPRRKCLNHSATRRRPSGITC
jgi:hypothetical protein